VSFDTLAALLRGYPEAAKIPCSKALPNVNGALPLDLFESRRLSTWILIRNKKWIDAEVQEEFDSVLTSSFPTTQIYFLTDWSLIALEK
jgi:hypothetical protein